MKGHRTRKGHAGLTWETWEDTQGAWRERNSHRNVGGSQEDTRGVWRSQTEPGVLRGPRGDTGKADWNWEAGHERKHRRRMETHKAKGKLSHPGLGRLERQQVETDVWGQGKIRVPERDRRLGDEG